MPSRTIRSALLVSGAIAALTLSACREDQRPASAAVGYGLPPSALAYDPTLAPPVDALPATAPAPVGRLVSNDDGYAWAERAYAMDRAFYDAPPDYGFYYGDVEPWVWESEERWTMYAEPISDGYRYYYYEPGRDYPYFVRDDDYGYGFDDAGRLVTLYTVAGVLLPNTYLGGRAEMAGRYWHRAHDMRRAAGRAQRQRVAEEMWLSRQPVFARSQANWFNAAQQRDDWRRYRIRDEGRDQRRFERERGRREADIARLQNAELRRAEAFRRDDRDGRREVAALAQREDRREWRDQRRDREDAGRIQAARAEAERQRNLAEARDRDDQRRIQVAQRDQRRGQEEARRAERDGRRQQAAQAQAERGREAADRRGQEARRQQVVQAAEVRGRQEAENRGRQARREQAAQAERGRQEAQRQQIARTEAERRGRVEAGQREQQTRQAHMAERGRQEAEGRRQQMAQQAERGRRQAEAQQRRQAEAQQRRQAQAQQARADNDRRGREAAAQAQQQQQQARNAAQAGREAAARERQNGGGRPDRGGEHRGRGREN